MSDVGCTVLDVPASAFTSGIGHRTSDIHRRTLMSVDIQDILDQGRIDDAVSAVEAAIRAAPGDASLRQQLFQLLAVLGQWARAGQQIATAGSLDAKLTPTVLAYRGLVEAETVRQAVFAGVTTPMLMGEPEPWMASWLKAAQSVTKGEFEQAQALRDEALDKSPATPCVRFPSGTDSGEAGESLPGLLDADTRLGPMIEGVIDGKYYWIPFSRLSELEISKPECLADQVWASARFLWTAGGESHGFVPARYPNSERSSDPAIRLGRATDFIDAGCGSSFGLGHRVLLTGNEDVGEVTLLELGLVRFEEAGA
jgi:type VI secretion system protein ImpE